MDGQAWHLDAAKGETVLWHGALDFGARTWTLKIPATHGEMDADGKLNQPDWHLEFEDLSLKDVLAWLLPAAPQGDGEISGQIHVGTEKADGNFTANNLQTPGLNLWLNNPDQSGRIGSATGKINWQGDVLELEQIHTAGPVGTGHASVNLDSAIWHGRWEDGRSSVVDVDGPAASASAQKRKATE